MKTTLKIEKKMPMRAAQGIRHGDWYSFLETLTAIKVGESFLFPRVSSNHRLIMASARQLWGKSFVTAKEGKQFRIGRVT